MVLLQGQLPGQRNVSFFHIFLSKVANDFLLQKNILTVAHFCFHWKISEVWERAELTIREEIEA